MRWLPAIILASLSANICHGQAWQIDIQTAGGGPYDNNNPVTSTFDPDDAGPIGGTWNAYEVKQITTDYFDPNSQGAEDPPTLFGLKDSQGSVTNVDFDIVGKVEGYNTVINDDDNPIGGFKAAVGDHLFFAQGGADTNLGFVFSDLIAGNYAVTVYSNPHYHVPTRGFTAKVGSVSIDIVPGDFVNGLASAESITATIPNIAVSAAGQLVGELRFLAGHGDPSVSALRLQRLSSASTGDYNGNGIVDAADYTVWRDTSGHTGLGLAADGDGNQVINLGDYGVWKSHFGQPAGSGSISVVPEPGWGVVAALNLVAGLAFRCRPRTVAARARNSASTR